ncbi:hypothetical protein [Candidatus Vondammii sp. HM_W22]|uniref:hypothetical protein n=1 Tax=Candidatus Vondammii sp. HM_W22 TaxID=2687299 RepID=UPI001F142F78|nr:hypothetical protein [Candidatus Vondammii sp. HM_W22]
MKPINKKITAIAFSTLFIATTGSAMAFGGYPDRSGNYQRENMTAPMRALSQLNNLTDEQKDRLKEYPQSIKKGDARPRQQDAGCTRRSPRLQDRTGKP